MSSLPTFSPKTKLSIENISVIVLFFLGILLRLRQYITGRSLWVDEAMLALNIINRDFGGLFKPLDLDQGAPIGFLLVEKIFNLTLGRNEYSLRLFPLLAGLFSLWMFYLLLKRITSETGLIVAFALFALNPRLIYYSSEVKQYILDVAVTIALILLTTQFFEQPSQKRLGFLAVAGVLALWFSHPSLFILAGIGLTLAYFYFQKRELANIGLVVGMGVLWLLNVGLLFSLTLGDLRGNLYMREYWQGAFAPLPPWSDWGWYLTSFQKNMDTLFAIIYAPWIMFVLMMAGLIMLFKQKRDLAIAITAILFFTLLASSLKLYPSLERMVLFLIPIGILLIGKTLENIGQRLRELPIASTLMLIILGGFVLYGPLVRTIEQFVSPKYFEHIRPSMDYLKEAWKDGDSIYISNGAVPAFEYYAPFYGL